MLVATTMSSVSMSLNQVARSCASACADERALLTTDNRAADASNDTSDDGSLSPAMMASAPLSKALADEEAQQQNQSRQDSNNTFACDRVSHLCTFLTSKVCKKPWEQNSYPDYGSILPCALISCGAFASVVTSTGARHARVLIWQVPVLSSRQ